MQSTIKSKSAVFTLALSVALSAGATAAPSPDASLLGFSAAASPAEHTLEKKYDAALNKNEMRAWMKRMSSEPNQLGSPHDKKNAELMLKLFKSWGYDAKLEKFEVLFPTPKTRLLEMTAPHAFKATLREPAIKQDATSDIFKNRLPPYNAYSAGGNVTAPLVYVNYGVPDDYKELARHGVSVKGKIVIARYGHSWRGIKPVVAYQHGAVGCILYSDPRGDGYFQGDVYPKGAFRPKEGVQRGSVAKMQIYPGDPLTPGTGATKKAKRLSRRNAKTLLKIPVLPISYGDALPLLHALGGPVAPEAWRGALPFTYHLGPGPAKVHLKLAFNWNKVTAYDVIAELKGSEYPDQWVIRGNHHDGWVFGADDPLSGNVSIMEEAKAIGKLAKSGWRPKRTIVFTSWDGEEPGLLGSTEWAETHAKELKKKAVLYINSDTNGRGFLFMGGSHTLQAFINGVARSVNDPETNVSVLARLRAKRKIEGNRQGAGKEQKKLAKQAAGSGDLRILPLGSGSDYSPFLQHLGIASLNIGFGGEAQGGVYHSAYDSFDHYIRFGDPTFDYERALAQTAGHAILRFADAEVLPLGFKALASNVARYVHQLKKLDKKMRRKTKKRRALLKSKAYRLAADPTERYVPPPAQGAVPKLDFQPLDQALARVNKQAAAYARTLAQRRQGTQSLAPAEVRTLNQTLQGMEQALTNRQGLPKRPWYKHMIYAPGLYTGYGVKTLPGIREAVEQRNWDQAKKYIGVVAETLTGLSRRIQRATSQLQQAGQNQT